MSRRVVSAVAALSAVRLVINTGQRFVYPFLPAIARGLGISLEQAGLAVSSRWITGIATPLVVETLGSRGRTRRVIFFGAGAFVVGTAITAATGVFAGAVAGFALMGLGKQSFDAASQAYVADRVPYARRARYLSVFEFTWAGGLLLGAPAAGWMIARAGWTAPFWAFAALGAVAIVAAGPVLERDRPGAETGRPPFRLRASSLWFLAVVAGFNTASELMFVVYGAWLEDSFALALVALGATTVVVAVAELVSEGATFAFTDRLGKRRAVVLGLGVAVVGYVLVAGFSGSLLPGMGAFVVGILGFEFAIVSSIPLASEQEPGARARYLALVILVSGVSRAVGSAVGPLLYAAGGIALDAWVAAGLDLAALAVLVTRVRE